MHGNTHGATKKRDYRSIKLATTTRAVRTALALSATMLALSGSGAALAGTCVINGTTAHCDGVFSNDVTNDYPALNTIPDLTLIVGSESATTIDPADGVNGITSLWGGSQATVISFAEINTTDANGIYMSTSDGNGTIENQGTISAYGASTDATAVYGYAYYDIAAVNGGDINADAAFGTTYEATGIEVYSYGYNATVTNQDDGRIDVYAYDGNATGIDAYGFDTATVTNDGYVNAHSVGHYAIGIIANAEVTSTTITNGGTIYATSDYSSAAGIYSHSVSDVNIDNSGTIDVDGGGNYGFGVFAYSDGSIGVSNSGSINAYGYNVGTGISADAYFDATVNNSAYVYAYGYYSGTGIDAYSFAGVATVATNGSSDIIASSVYSATGIAADGFFGADVLLGGSVTADAGDYASGSGSFEATGVSAYSYYGDATITSSARIYARVDGFSAYGSVSATGASAASIYYDALVHNYGDVIAIAVGYGYGDVTAVGADAYSFFGDATIDNQDGTLTAIAYGYGYQDGVNAAAAQAYSYLGDAVIDNSGLIRAVATNLQGYQAFYGAQATGVSAYARNGNARVDNSGSVYATARGSDYGTYYGAEATGIYAFSLAGNVDVSNSGTVGATVVGSPSIEYGSAVGIYGFSVFGSVAIDNDNSVSASGDYASAFGIEAVSLLGPVGVDNSGTIHATSIYDNAIGVETYSIFGDVTIVNSDEVHADSFYETAIGIHAYAAKYGDNVVDNTGLVDAHSTVGFAFGIRAETAYSATYGASVGNIAITNGGTVNAVSDYFLAVGIAAFGYEDISVASSGDINVSAFYYGYGVLAITEYGDITIANGGGITVAGYSNEYFPGKAYGISAENTFGAITVSNGGSISANAEGVGDYAGGAAYGVRAYTLYGDVTVDNGGTISAIADSEYGLAQAYGINAIGVVSEFVTLTNEGSIAATATGGSDSYYQLAAATGIYTQSFSAYIGVYNDGDISATASVGADTHYASAIATGVNAAGNNYALNIYNGGAASITATASAGSGDAAYDNQADAFGITSYNYFADVNIVNLGSVEATASSGGELGYANATGITALIGYYGTGSAYVYNGGIVTAAAEDNATGVLVDNDGGYYGSFAGVENNGTVSASAVGGENAVAAGVMMDSYYAIFQNDVDGSISASAVSGSDLGDATATGVDIHATYVGYYAYSAEEAAVVFYSGFHNDGSISASADGYTAAATGVYLQSYGDVFAYNYGEISAEASGAFGEAVGFTGSFGGDVVLVNLSDIHASASSSDSGRAYGVDLSGYGVLVYSGGDTYAHASGDSAHATAIRVLGYYADIITGPDSYTGAVAEGGSYAIAEAASASGSQVRVYAGGELYASASADMEAGESTAIGVAAFGSYAAYVTVEEGAVINASATGYHADAYGVLEVTPFSYFYNHGSISATVESVDAGYAWGVRIASTAQVYAYNYGDITATAAGDVAQSVGIVLESTDGASGILNEGNIAAYADHIATGVWLASDTYGDVYNFGSITAEGGTHSVAIYSTGASADYIYNAGDITGGIWTNAGNDKLLNGEDGAWYATDISYFGDGDDAIYNYGVIVMDDSVIDLGFHDVYGNYFFNYGTIAVNGADNVINMGDGPLNSLVPSLNPNPFYNGVGGVIDFQDGVPDDVLTIVGDFAGDGDINVDMSGLDGTSDVLYIDGSVVAGTVGVININLLDLPENIEGLVPVVYVTGDSAAGNFTLGDINWNYDNPFLTLDVDLVADIDASNATPDVFSLGIEVTGLADAGTLAASVGPSVQSLMNTQVGTWRQRMGVIDSFNKGAIALWARVFSNEGGFQPEHSSSFGSGGNFDWQQKNSGVEAGIDFSVTDEFSIGLLLSKSQADIDLDNDGSGSADLDADTWGIYGTWISPNGFYLDASYRWMNFDVDLHSIAGNMETEGDAEAFNVEAGYAWTLSGGLKIEPQLQYTKTSVNNIDTLVPMTGMSFAHDGGDSSRGRLGVAIRKSFGEADTGWLWTPYATLSAVREFDGESVYAINDHFVGGTTVEGTSALLELGFTARHQNWSIYGGLNWEDGGAVDSFFGGQLGVRYTFGAPAPAPVVVVPLPAKTCADLDDDGDGVNNCDDKCLGSTAGQVVGPDGCPVPEPEPVVEPKPFRG